MLSANFRSKRVSDQEFRYPGPRPRSKEMGIIHLADAVEAASRTLQEPNPTRIQDMTTQGGEISLYLWISPPHPS